MKTKLKPKMDPDAVFADETIEPNESELRAALGDAYAVFESLVRRVKVEHPELTSQWRYSSRAGWYRFYGLEKRRLFYLVPKRQGFRLTLLLGDKAIRALEIGPLAPAFERCRPAAKRYPEGTAFTFSSATCDPALVAAMVEAKLTC